IGPDFGHLHDRVDEIVWVWVFDPDLPFVVIAKLLPSTQASSFHLLLLRLRGWCGRLDPEVAVFLFPIVAAALALGNLGMPLPDGCLIDVMEKSLLPILYGILAADGNLQAKEAGEQFRAGFIEHFGFCAWKCAEMDTILHHLADQVKDHLSPLDG